MLVLTRKHDEKIVIGHKGKEITITILKIQGSEKVSIGIEADPDTPIFREELLTRGPSAKRPRKREIPHPSTTTEDVERLVQAVHWSQEEEKNANAKNQTSERLRDQLSYYP